MGWTFPWASSAGSDFNTDYSVGFTAEEQQREGGIEYDYRREGALLASSSDNPNIWGTGVDRATFLRERPGVSAFVLEDGVIYHTYSAYARGLDALWGMWQWLYRLLRGATRLATGGVAMTSTTAAAPVKKAMSRQRAIMARTVFGNASAITVPR